jgi:hypothetical protein
MLLGFSTGVMYKKYPSSSKEIVDLCLGLGCNAIELNVASVKETELLEENIEKIQASLAKFDYVSLHSPGIKVIFRNDETTKEILNVFQLAYNTFQCQCLVVHPDKVEDWKVFDNYHFNIAVENMSDDVPFATPENLNPIFEKNPNYKMVLDVNHAYKTYNSPKLTTELSAAFRDRISEIHLSGYDTFHDPLYRTKQLDIIQSVPSKKLPIIIESGCDTIEDMEKEYDYIKQNL